MKSFKEIKQISGIDTLYYYAQTNENYDLFYIDLYSQISDKKDNLIREEKYRVSDIKIDIGDQVFNYLGNGEGYHWLEDENGFYRIGFKNQYKNLTQHNIRVQFYAVGIYTIGIKSLLELINNNLLKEITTGEFPITRVDLNAFVQYDLSTLKKESFVSRKRSYAEYIKEIGSAHSLETLYIGKNPFLLRIYNKALELKKSAKQELMQEYFANHGFSLAESIFNIEFEMHRQYLKYFNVNSVEDAIFNAENLFYEAMENIRLVDLSSITEGELSNKNKYKAQTHPLWQIIKEQYILKEFLQTKTPLERIKKPQYTYTYEKAVDEHFHLGRKAKIHGLPYDDDFLNEVQEKVQKSFEPKDEKINIDYIEVEANNKNYRLIDGELTEPVNQKPLSKMSDFELMRYYNRLSDQMKNGSVDSDLKNRIMVATEEMEKRDLLDIPI